MDWCEGNELQSSRAKVPRMTEPLKIRWGDLGSPTLPCEMDYYGKRIIVTAQDIEAAKEDPDAVFTALLSPVLAGERYALGSVEFPAKT